MNHRSTQPRLNDDRPVVMHVVHALARGGAEVLVRDLVAARNDRYRFVVMSLSGHGPLTEELEALGVTVISHGRTPGFDIGCSRAIAQAARRHGVDVIHAHQYSPFVYSALARLMGAWRCKVIYTEHGRPYPDQRKWKRVVVNRLVLGPLTTRTTAVSRFIGDALSRCEALPKRRVELIYNGIDPAPYADDAAGESRAVMRRTLGLDDDQLAVLQVAGFRPIKDHATALRAFARLATVQPRAVLLLAGGGQTLPAMKRLAGELNLGERVRFLGERTDVAALWRAADIGLLSSLSEGTSVAVLEAMAAAKPVVATAVGGNVEVIVDKVTGLLTQRGDAAAMAEALHKLITDAGIRRRFGRAGRRRVHERFTQRAMHMQFDAMYRELIGAAPEPNDRRGHLIVFADDFGRHPSSMQHLATHLAKRYRMTWINTIGMRRPRLCLADARRAMVKLTGCVSGTRHRSTAARNTDNTTTTDDSSIRVMNPAMWPSFAGRWQRAVNRYVLRRAIRRAAAKHDGPTTVITALPITADLADTPCVDRWVYYMVDDFASWPGNDAAALSAMDRQQMAWVDHLIGASETLVNSAAQVGRDAALLTHGVDTTRWRTPAARSTTAEHIKCLPGTRAVYWGLIDERLDREAVMNLTGTGEASVAFVGPVATEMHWLKQLPGVHVYDAVPMGELPAIAGAADVLVMPYRTMAATLAMQPLKLLEYLSTDRPVVCLDLPAIRAWSDACDVVGRDAFAERVLSRSRQPLPTAQRTARQRVQHEDWAAKAERFASLIEGRAEQERMAA